MPHGKSIPFLPVLEIMRDYFAIKEGGSDETVRDKVAERSLRLDRELLLPVAIRAAELVAIRAAEPVAVAR
jgi:hypothetical protein